MKTITEELLFEYGFELSEVKDKSKLRKYSKNNFVVVMERDGSFYYTYLDIEYPLKDEDDLQKIYFEARREKLSAVSLTM